MINRHIYVNIALLALLKNNAVIAESEPQDQTDASLNSFLQGASAHQYIQFYSTRQQDYDALSTKLPADIQNKILYCENSQDFISKLSVRFNTRKAKRNCIILDNDDNTINQAMAEHYDARHVQKDISKILGDLIADQKTEENKQQQYIDLYYKEQRKLHFALIYTVWSAALAVILVSTQVVSSLILACNLAYTCYYLRQSVLHWRNRAIKRIVMPSSDYADIQHKREQFWESHPAEKNSNIDKPRKVIIADANTLSVNDPKLTIYADLSAIERMQFIRANSIETIKMKLTPSLIDSSKEESRALVLRSYPWDHTAFFKSSKNNNNGFSGYSSELSLLRGNGFLPDATLAHFSPLYGLTSEKGILLYGLPGTGKTLLAHTICKAYYPGFNAETHKNDKSDRVRFIDCADIKDKYYGQSEKNIKELFQSAKQDWQQNHDRNRIYFFIFDEIDQLFPKRINNANTTNQEGVNSIQGVFLSMLSSDAPGNIRIIGTTNRQESLDSALLRPGRLGLHINMKLPNRENRLAILTEKTNRLRKLDLLSDNVDLEKLADDTNNYTGAELEQLVSQAIQLVIQQNSLVTPASLKPCSNEHFTEARSHITPQYQIDNPELSAQVRPPGMLV